MLAGSAGAFAADWKAITDQKAQCTAQVPANWTAGPSNIGMSGPHGASLLISVSRLATLGDVKTLIASMYKIETTFEDSPQRYWIGYLDPNAINSGTHWYVATEQPGMICTMQLSFDAQLSDDDAKTVAASLKKK